MRLFLFAVRVFGFAVRSIFDLAASYLLLGVFSVLSRRKFGFAVIYLVLPLFRDCAIIIWRGGSKINRGGGG